MSLFERSNLPTACQGGRGKKAPYETMQARIPTEIKSIVESISNSYKALKQNDDSQGIEQLLSRFNDAITSDSSSSNFLTSEVEAKLRRLEQIESIIAKFQSDLVGKEKNPRYDQLNKMMGQIKAIN